MGFLERILAFVMLPLSVLIILEDLKVYSISLPFDEALAGAALMIALQAVNLALLMIKNKTLTAMNIITGSVFIIPAAAYIFFSVIGKSYIDHIPLVIGVMMLVESLYALH